MIKKQKKEVISFKVNDEIVNYSNVRIVGEGIESTVVTLSEAKDIANDMEMDLVEINSKTSTPILRICNYEKFLYEFKKNLKKNKPINKPLKEIQLSVNIASNDLKTKVKKAKEFIEDGSKVKVILSMRGRELARREENKKVIYQFITMLEDNAIPEALPRDEGNRTTVILKKKQGGKN